MGFNKLFWGLLFIVYIGASHEFDENGTGRIVGSEKKFQFIIN